MAEILERIENDSQLGKVLFELLGEIASSAISKANKQEKNNGCSSSSMDGASRACKSVPVSPKECITTPRMAKSDGECEDEHCVGGTKTVDPSLGRPRYQWQVPEKCGKYEKDQRKSNDELKKLFSVYVGHLPSDITEDELVDLFKDIGEVIDAFVLPYQIGNSYTYGFVRFLTLDEANDAVREKHLKLIGNKEIHVELSADTRRKMQGHDTDEGSRQLLRKDYPKVARRSADDSNEKKVIAKVKRSIRKLNGSHSCVFGECSSEELFDNVKTILKMVINYPMSLADATIDKGEEPSREDTKEIPASKEQPQGCDKESFPANKDSLVQSVSLTGGRLTSLAPNTMDSDMDEHRAKSDTSPVLDSNKTPSLPSRQAIETAPPVSTFCPLVEKVRHLLNASPSEHPPLSNDLPFVENSESCSSPTSRSASERQPVDPSGLDSSALQRGMKAHVGGDFGSLGLQRDDHPSASRPYAEVREKNDVPCVIFEQLPTKLPLPSNHVSHSKSSRQDVRQSDGRQFVEATQRTGSVFVPRDQQPKASSVPSNVAGHIKSLQQNGPVEIARSVCRAVTNNCEIACKDTAETAANSSRHSQSLERSGQPSVSPTHEHRENLTHKPNFFNSNQIDNVPIDSSTSIKLTKIDRVASSSMVSSISQSPSTILKNASHCRSAVLDNISSGSDSDGFNTSKSDGPGVAVAFPKPSDRTRCPLSPCIQDVSPPCSTESGANISTPRSSFDKIQTDTNLRNCSTHAASYSCKDDGNCSRKDSVMKSSSRRKRTLAPSFAKLIRAERNGKGDSEGKPSNFVLPKISSGFECHNGSFSSECLRPSAAGVLGSDIVKNEAGDVMIDDSAIVNISRANLDLQQHKSSPDGLMLDYDSREDVDCGFESSVPRNDLDQCKEEDDAETKILKENLNEQCLRLNILQQSFSSCPRHKREKTRQSFKDNTDSMELETKIHDTEVLLQKKIESWTLRSSEQELAFERETLQSIDNTELLKQLSKEVEKEYLTNEICVTKLKCNIVELKMKHFSEKNGIQY